MSHSFTSQRMHVDCDIQGLRFMNFLHRFLHCASRKIQAALDVSCTRYILCWKLKQEIFRMKYFREKRMHNVKF